MVVNFNSAMPNALALSGTAGALRSVLKTYLCDGAGAATVTSLTVASGVATATFAGSHSYAPNVVAQLSGAAPAALNGFKVISATGSNSITFPAPGVPDGPATGSMTCKLAPAGWQELFAGTLANVLAVKPSVPSASGSVLRLDDTGTTNARARVFESMSDISTGIGPMPLDAQVSGGLFWPKSGAASALARPWFLVADERGFYLAVSPQGTDRYTLLYCGDIASLKSGDAWGCAVTGNQADQVALTTVPDGCCGWSHRSARNGAYISRLHTGIGQAVPAQRIGSHHTGTTADTYAGSAGYAWGSYPNGPNNGLMTGNLELFASGMRGALPGLLHPVQDCANAFTSGAIVDGTNDLAGHKLLVIRVAPPSGSVTAGTVFIDLTDWGR